MSKIFSNFPLMTQCHLQRSFHSPKRQPPMWTQAHRYTLTCVCNEQRENKIPSPHRVFPTNLDATVVLLRATDEESEQVETLTAI